MSNTELAVEDDDPDGEEELNKFFDFGGFSSPSGSLSSTSNDTPSLTFFDMCRALDLSHQEVVELEEFSENWDPIPMNCEEYYLLDMSGYNFDEFPTVHHNKTDNSTTISLEEIGVLTASHSTSPTTVAQSLFEMDSDIECLLRAKTPDTTKSVSKPVFFSAKTVPEDRKRKHEQVETNSTDDRNAKRKKVGAYTHEERRAIIAKWIAKRNKRIWKKRVEYDVRKDFADSRLRFKGRFVKKDDEELLRELMNMT